MNRIKHVFLLFVLMGIIPVSFTNCNRYSCDSFPSSQDAIIKSMSAEAIAFYNVIDTVNGYPFDSVYLSISATAFDIINKKFSSNRQNFEIYQNLYASKDCSYYTKTTTINYLTSIKIISKIDVDYTDSMQIKNNEMLNNIFQIKLEDTKQTYTINEFLNMFKIPTYDSNGQNISLFIIGKPSKPIKLLFDIEITLNDGKVFMFENKELKVK